LTLPFCQLELRAIFAAEAPDCSGEDSGCATTLDVFERAVDSAVESDNITWTIMIPILDVHVARHLCQRAERLFLQLVPSIKAVDFANSNLVDDADLAARLLFVVDRTAYSMQEQRNQALGIQIVEKLNDLWQITFQATGDLENAAAQRWLPLMIDFIALHSHIFDSSKSGSELRARTLLSLCALLLDFHHHSNYDSTLFNRIFDVALLLVDDLPEEARLHCVRSLKDKTSEPGIRYLFGYSPPPTEWLQLCQKGKLVPYPLRRWEILSEPTPNIGENDTSLSLTLFQARKV